MKRKYVTRHSIVCIADTRRGLMGSALRELQREAILARCTPLAAKCLQNEWARQLQLQRQGKDRAEKARARGRKKSA